MRISDWSSDVCSSDLNGATRPIDPGRHQGGRTRRTQGALSILIARPLPQRRLTGQRHALVVTSHQRLVMLLMLFEAGAVLIIARLTSLAPFTEPATSRDAAAATAPLRTPDVAPNGTAPRRTPRSRSNGQTPA